MQKTTANANEHRLKMTLRDIAMKYKEKNGWVNEDIANEIQDISTVSVWRALRDDTDQLPSLEKLITIASACTGKNVFGLLTEKLSSTFKVSNKR